MGGARTGSRLTEVASLVLTGCLAGGSWGGLAAAHLATLWTDPGVAFGASGAPGSGPLVVGAGLGAFAGVLLAVMVQLGTLDRPVESAPVHRARSKLGRLSLADLCTLAVTAAAVFALRPAAVPWPAFFDASWYANAASALAVDGRLEFPTGLALTSTERRLVTTTFADLSAGLGHVPVDPSRGFHGVVFAVSDLEVDRVSLYHPPFFAAGMAAWGAVAGRDAMGNVVLAWLAAALLTAAALAKAVGGPWAGPMAAALLGAGPAWTYYGSHPYAELAAATLFLLGLTFLVCGRGRRRSGVASAATGLCFGLAVLVKADMLVAVGAAAVVWVAALLVRRGGLGAVLRRGGAVALGAGAPSLHGLALWLGPNDTYIRLNGLGVVTLAVAAWPVVALGVVGLGAWLGLWRRAGKVARQRWAGAAFLVALTGVSLAVLTGGPETTASPGAVLAWLVGPLVLWGAGAGALLSGSNGIRLAAVAMLTGLVLSVEPGVSSGMSPLLAGRRLAGSVVPLCAVLAAAAAAYPVVAVRSGRLSPNVGGRFGLVTGAALALALAGSLATAAPLRPARDFPGGARIVSQVAAHVDAGGVAIFPSSLDLSQAARFAAPLWLREGRQVLVLAQPSPDSVAVGALVLRLHQEGRRVYLVTDESAALVTLAGWDLERLAAPAFVTSALAADPRLPPRFANLGIELAVYEYVPRGD